MSRGLVNNMLTMNNLGDGSTLSLDFTTGVLDPRLTFTRSTTATYINSSGYITSAAINAPRFDYSPTNIGEPRGLLIEGSATNLLNWSETFATTGGTNNNWADTNLTRTSTNNTSPRNDATALRITASAGNGTIISSAAIGTSALRTLSVWLRRVTGTGDIQYTLNNGTNWTTQVITSSWVRYSFTATTADQRVGFRIVTSGDAIELWGAQLEAGSGASSYIVTGASGVTRNADHCTIPTASFIPGNPYPQTLFVDCIPNTPSGAFLDIARIIDRTAGGTFGYGNQIYYYNAATMIAMRKISASTNTERSFASGLAYGTRHKFALSIDASSYSGSYDGVTALGVATAPTALATVVTHLGIGCTGDSSPSAVMFGTIRQIKFYPTALSQSEINTLTTL
jgi:hypothetical protein